MTSDCAIFLTHRWSPAIEAHFERLKREAAPLVDVYLVANLPPEVAPGSIPADLLIAREDCDRVLPSRFKDSQDKEWLARTGHVDLIWVTAFRHEMFARYSRFWLIEFDVDFSGNWADLFGALADDPADLLTAHVFPWEEGSTWKWWKTLRRPEWAAATPLRAFMPISRFSRRFLDKVAETYAVPGWHGHFEALIPSLAHACGFAISDFGGRGSFVPAGREDKFYRDIAEGGPNDRSSHRFRPAHGEDYFGTTPEAFPDRGLIYHPVKRIVPVPPKAKKLKPAKPPRTRRSLPERVLALIADPRRIAAAISRRVR